MTYHRQAQINIKPRKLYPWEKETFEVCLEGNWMDLYTIEAGYKYKVKQVGYNDTLFELYPERKIPMKPDADGLNYVEFSYNKESGKYTFKVSDKWAKEYAGEKVYIKIELKKDKANWFDSTLGTKEYTFNVANEYKMEFSEKETYTEKGKTKSITSKLLESSGYILNECGCPKFLDQSNDGIGSFFTSGIPCCASSSDNCHYLDTDITCRQYFGY